jgi:hypothetical protein
MAKKSSGKKKKSQSATTRKPAGQSRTGTSPGPAKASDSSVDDLARNVQSALETIASLLNVLVLQTDRMFARSEDGGYTGLQETEGVADSTVGGAAAAIPSDLRGQIRYVLCLRRRVPLSRTQVIERLLHSLHKDYTMYPGVVGDALDQMAGDEVIKRDGNLYWLANCPG